MSTFAGVSFRVAGVNGRFPGLSRDADKSWHWRGDVVFASAAARLSVLQKVTDFDIKAPIGVASPNFHIQAGYGPASLSVPSAAGTYTAYTAMLRAVTDATPDGSSSVQLWATLDFVITTGAPT